MQSRTQTAHPGPPHVALVVETSTSFGRRLLRGLGIYVRENGPWSIYVEQRSIYDPAPPWLKNWDGNGIISRAAYPELAKLILETGVPVVDLQEQVLGTGLQNLALAFQRVEGGGIEGHAARSETFGDKGEIGTQQLNIEHEELP